MKKSLSLILCSLMFCLFVGSVTNVYAVNFFRMYMSIGKDNEPIVGKIDKAIDEAKKTLTKAKVDEFVKTPLYKKSEVAQAKVIFLQKKVEKNIENLAKTDPKYAEIKKLFEETMKGFIPPRGSNAFNVNKVLEPANKALAIGGLTKEEEAMFNYYKACAYFQSEDWNNAINELSKIGNDEKKMFDDYYQILGYSKMQLGDNEGALNIINEGNKVFPCINNYQVKMELYDRMGKDFSEDKKIMLLFIGKNEYDDLK